MTLRPALSRAVARPRALAAAGAVAALLVALAATDLGGTAARAALAVVAIAAAAAALRAGPRAGGPPAIAVAARQPLGRDAGVAVVEAGGLRLLVGFGADGVRVLARLPASPPGGAP